MLKEIAATKSRLETYCYDPKKLQKEFRDSILLPKSSTTEEIETVRECFNDLCDLLKAQIEAKEDKLNNVLKKYYQLFKTLQEDSSSAQSLDSDELELNKIIFRPLQDIVKITYKLKEIWPDKLPPIKILPNPKKLHAETNIAYSEDFITAEENLYIGISRLSCVLCDVVLSNKDIKYRGCNGILFPWNTPSEEYQELEQDTRDAHGEKEQTLESQLMHRRLSIDGFEKEALPEFWALKESFQLTEETPPVGTEIFETTEPLTVVGSFEANFGDHMQT